MNHLYVSPRQIADALGYSLATVRSRQSGELGPITRRFICADHRSRVYIRLDDALRWIRIAFPLATPADLEQVARVAVPAERIADVV